MQGILRSLGGRLIRTWRTKGKDAGATSSMPPRGDVRALQRWFFGADTDTATAANTEAATVVGGGRWTCFPCLWRSTHVQQDHLRF